MKLRTPIAAVTFLLFSALASAQAPVGRSIATPGIDGRQAAQAQRIEQGRARGTLTRTEYRRLQHEQREIVAAERRAKADGIVTPGERQRLVAMLDRADSDIRHQKHDAQTAPRR